MNPKFSIQETLQMGAEFLSSPKELPSLFPSPRKRGEGARRADEELLMQRSLPIFAPLGWGTHQEEHVREAEILLQHTLTVSRAYLYTYPNRSLSDQERQQYQDLLSQRHQGIPIAYITGRRAFWDHQLKVTPDTLIPRPETELLVEWVLSKVDAKTPCSVLDLGTGSGAIALALCSERPNWQITASDFSPHALNVAQSSAAELGLQRIEFILSNWFEGFSSRYFDVIVSNPPYLAAQDPHLDLGDLRYEPKTALVGGQNGLEALHTIIENGYHYLTVNGMLFLEHGHDQGQAVRHLLNEYGYQDVQTQKDYQGHERMSVGRVQRSI